MSICDLRSRVRSYLGQLWCQAQIALINWGYTQHKKPYSCSKPVVAISSIYLPSLPVFVLSSHSLYTRHGETLKVDPAVVLTKVDPYPGAERRICAAIPLDRHKKMRLCAETN